MTEDAREYLRRHGVDDDRLDATPPDEWYLLLQEQLFFGGPPTLTAADVAAATGVPADDVRRLWRTIGFDDPADHTVFHEREVEIFKIYADGVAVFGAAPIEHFTRMLGASTRQLAYATSAVFLESLGEVREAATLREQLELAELGGDLMVRMPEDIIRPLVLRHAIESQAFSRAAGAVTEPMLDVATGFCDLVASTELLNSLEPTVAGQALLEFEAEVADAVQRHGGRLIKLIGDEVLYLALEADAAVAIGRDVIAWVAAHEVLTGARAGIAVGRVLTRGGDVYGPPVNLAARLVHVAEPGSIAITDAAGDELVEVRGFDQPVRIRRVVVR